MPNPFSENIKSLLRDGIKATQGIFSNAGGNYGGGIDNRGNYWGNGAYTPGPFSRSQGSSIDWNRVTGDIESNPTAYACLRIICDNYCAATIQIEQKSDSEDKFERISNHPLETLFRQPNPFYSWNYLQRGLLTSLHAQGNAYIGIERDGNRLPARLLWVPYGLRPKNGKNSADGWLFRQNGDSGAKEQFVPQADVIHIPMGANPRMPGFGLSGWQALKQDQYTLQQGGNYTANVMRNNGTSGAVFTPKALKDENGKPIQIKLDNPELFIEMYRAKTRGDRVGDATYIDAPLDVTFPDNSPQKLALESILDRPEANICSVFGVPILLVGAHGGRHAKTYANYESAQTALWKQTLLPLQQVIASELSLHLLPQVGGDPETERICYDVSGVRELQPDLDELHKRVREDWLASSIDLMTYTIETKRVPEDWMQGVYYWMLPKIADRATSVDSLVPPGERQEATIPGSGTPQALPSSQNGAQGQQQAQPPRIVNMQQVGQLAAVGRNGNGRHG